MTDDRLPRWLGWSISLGLSLILWGLILLAAVPAIAQTTYSYGLTAHSSLSYCGAATCSWGIRFSVTDPGYALVGVKYIKTAAAPSSSTFYVDALGGSNIESQLFTGLSNGMNTLTLDDCVALTDGSEYVLWHSINVDTNSVAYDAGQTATPSGPLGSGVPLYTSGSSVQPSTGSSGVFLGVDVIVGDDDCVGGGGTTTTTTTTLAPASTLGSFDQSPGDENAEWLESSEPVRGAAAIFGGLVLLLTAVQWARRAARSTVVQ